jgi:hypothetical protein
VRAPKVIKPRPRRVVGCAAKASGGGLAPLPLFQVGKRATGGGQLAPVVNLGYCLHHRPSSHPTATGPRQKGAGVVGELEPKYACWDPKDGETGYGEMAIRLHPAEGRVALRIGLHSYLPWLRAKAGRRPEVPYGWLGADCRQRR